MLIRGNGYAGKLSWHTTATAANGTSRPGTCRIGAMVPSMRAITSDVGTISSKATHFAFVAQEIKCKVARKRNPSCSLFIIQHFHNNRNLHVAEEHQQRIPHVVIDVFIGVWRGKQGRASVSRRGIRRLFVHRCRTMSRTCEICSEGRR